jgi:hypothetical protein
VPPDSLFPHLGGRDLRPWLSWLVPSRAAYAPSSHTSCRSSTLASLAPPAPPRPMCTGRDALLCP